jgi:C4-dicarboxylate transporter, DctQ subunit
MKPLAKRLGMVFDTVNYFFIWLIGISLAVGLLATCYEVVARYFLNRPTRWSLEYLENMMVFVTFLGLAWVLKKGGHVTMDLVLKQFPLRVQVVIHLFNFLLCAAASFLVMWYGGKVVWRQFVEGQRFATVLEMPMWPLFAPLPIGFFLLCVECLRRAYAVLISRRAVDVMKSPYFEETEALH